MAKYQANNIRSVSLHQPIRLMSRYSLQPLQDLVKHHIESFNFMLDQGISYAVQVSCQ